MVKGRDFIGIEIRVAHPGRSGETDSSAGNRQCMAIPGGVTEIAIKVIKRESVWSAGTVGRPAFDRIVNENIWFHRENTATIRKHSFCFQSEVAGMAGGERSESRFVP